MFGCCFDFWGGFVFLEEAVEVGILEYLLLVRIALLVEHFLAFCCFLVLILPSTCFGFCFAFWVLFVFVEMDVEGFFWEFFASRGRWFLAKMRRRVCGRKGTTVSLFLFWVMFVLYSFTVNSVSFACHREM